MKSIRAGDFSNELKIKRDDEIGEVATGFNLMRTKLDQTLKELHQHKEVLEDKIMQRTKLLNSKNLELNKVNEELRLAMETIKQAQEKLLLNEKLAIVGQMSGIVDHEVLNPVSAISIRIERNIEQARRTLEVIDKLIKTTTGLESDLLAGDDRLMADEAALQQKLSLLIKIGSSLKINQEARISDFLFLEKQTNRVVRIVDNLRQMSKNRKHIEPVQLDKLVNEVLEDMSDGLSKRGVQVVRELSVVPPVRADAAEIYSIVSNLVRNAMQSLEKQDKAFERLITVRLSLRDDYCLELEVRDNGAGIPPENRGLMF